jgi:hypothetical protein
LILRKTLTMSYVASNKKDKEIKRQKNVKKCFIKQ